MIRTFTATATDEFVTYTYKNTQNELLITNDSFNDLELIVNGYENTIVHAKQSFNPTTTFTSFQVKGNGDFTATLTDDVIDLPDVAIRDKALSGDMVWVVDPETVSTTATAEGWTRTVTVELQTSDGALHRWFNKAITTGVSVATDSVAGGVSIPSTTLTIVEGRTSIVITGTEAAFIADETDTLTIAEATIMGYTIAAATSVETFIA